MAEVKYIISTEHNNYPNITVYDRLYDGVTSGWKLVADDGYVMYDTTDETTMLDNEGNEIRDVYFCERVNLSPKNNWDKFSWVAVLSGDIDKINGTTKPTDMTETEEKAAAYDILTGGAK